MNNQRDITDLRRCSDARIGGLIGLLVGDALGVPFEFKSPEQLPPYDEIEMTPPNGFRRAHAGVPVGTWSDDGAQALCLLASLLECGKLSLTDFADRLVRWMEDGYMAIDGDVFDCGIQTADALSRLSDGVPPLESGGATVMDNGNGSLMRVLPLALWHTGTDEVLVHDAHRQSMPTHAHHRSLVACAYYCLTARGYINGIYDPWLRADQRLGQIYHCWSDQRDRASLLAELDVLRRFPESDIPRGTGYVIDTIWSARQCMVEESFEGVAKSAISLGSDTDTTAAVACGLAGIKFGLNEIPTRWLQQLRGFEIIEPLTNRLIAPPGR